MSNKEFWTLSIFALVLLGFSGVGIACIFVPIIGHTFVIMINVTLGLLSGYLWAKYGLERFL